MRASAPVSHPDKRKRSRRKIRRDLVVCSVLHSAHGHCYHTGQISGAANSKNTQHFRFLHFESHAAFSQRLISFLQASLYTFFRRNQPFCTKQRFFVCTFCTSSISLRELQGAFPAIHPAFFALHRAAFILAGMPRKTQKRSPFCKFTVTRLQTPRRACKPSCNFRAVFSHFCRPNVQKTTDALQKRPPPCESLVKLCETRCFFMPAKTADCSGALSDDHFVLAHAAGGEVAMQIEGRKHAAVGDDAGNEVRRRQIEGRIVALDAVGRRAHAHGL